MAPETGRGKKETAAEGSDGHIDADLYTQAHGQGSGVSKGEKSRDTGGSAHRGADNTLRQRHANKSAEVSLDDSKEDAKKAKDKTKEDHRSLTKATSFADPKQKGSFMKTVTKKFSSTLGTFTHVFDNDSEIRRTESDPNRRLQDLLRKFRFECTQEEVDVLNQVYHCDICCDANAPCQQIRAVYGAFDIAWSEEGEGRGGTLTLQDLEIFVAKCELGDDFLIRLRVAMQESLQLDADAKLNGRQFIVAFAHALRGMTPDDRLLYNRVFGRMFGMEMTKQRFRWNKFFVAVLANNGAFITDCLCYLERRFGPSRLMTGVLASVRGGKRKLDVMEAEGSARNNKKGGQPMFKILSDAVWLPPGYSEFKDFQAHLRSTWVPAAIAAVVYLLFGSRMRAVSAEEPCCPIVVYSLLGLIMSTIAGFEHRGLVMRRKYALTGETMEEDFRAAFAFRSHTPEGHQVEKIKVISEVCEVGRWSAKCESIAKWVAVAHGLTPALHRAVLQADRMPSTVAAGGPIGLLSYVWWVATGGYGEGWLDVLTAAVTVPSAILSGYMIYQLMLITLDIFYNDLAFMYKLKLFKACTNPAYYLVYRRKWSSAVKHDPKLQLPWARQFMDFMSLQEEQDLVMWCRVRQLLIDSSGGFKSIQRDVVLTYTLITHLLLLVITIAKHYDSFLLPSSEALGSISLTDVWILLDCSVFSVAMCVIINNKLVIYDMRRRDIKLLHDEYYRASLLNHTHAASAPGAAGTAAAGGAPHPGGPPGPAAGGDGFDRAPSSGTVGVPSSDQEGFSRRPSNSSFDSQQSAFSGIGGPAVNGAGGGVPNGAVGVAGESPPLSVVGCGGGGGGGVAQSRRTRRKSMITGHATGVVWSGAGGVYPSGMHRVSDVQLLLEQTARYVQHCEKPPLVLGYPVSWEVLRYASISMIGAILTGLQGTGALVKIMKVMSK